MTGGLARTIRGGNVFFFLKINIFENSSFSRSRLICNYATQDCIMKLLLNKNDLLLACQSLKQALSVDVTLMVRVAPIDYVAAMQLCH